MDVVCSKFMIMITLSREGNVMEERNVVILNWINNALFLYKMIWRKYGIGL